MPLDLTSLEPHGEGRGVPTGREDDGGNAGAGAAGPLTVIGHLSVAAGNSLGRRPALAVTIETAPDAACDHQVVGALLSTLGSDLEDEFRMARVTGSPAPLPRAFAGIMVALLAQGSDLAARVHALPPAGRPRWLVLIENGVALRAEAVLGLAVELLRCAIAGQVADQPVERWLEAHCGTASDRFGRLERAATVRAVEARGHVWRGGPRGPVGVIGEGRRAVRLRHTVTMRTMYPGAILGERKDRTVQRLARAGLPVARQVRVADAAAARAAAAEIGFPVVVKPLDRSNARGVTIGLTTPEDVSAAYAAASAYSPDIAVEAQLPGLAYRLLTIDGRFVAAVVSTPGRLVGDGRRSLRELVDEANRIPRRQRPRPIQRPIAWTPEIIEHLARHGLEPDGVPAAGSVVSLHWSEQGRHGGSILGVDGPIHPDNRMAACQAADLVGIDVCGIDMVLPDIARSWRETGGGICEVNRSPGLRYHMVADGAETPVLGRYLDHLLDCPCPCPFGPSGADGPGGPRTIPILVFVGGGEMEAPALAAAARLERHGLAPGLATASRYMAAGLPLVDPGRNQAGRVRRLVDDPAIGAVVVVVEPAALLAQGFGHERADLAILADRPGALAERAAAVLAGIGAARASLAMAADGIVIDRIAVAHQGGNHGDVRWTDGGY
ncbi:hypothetical protein STHU_12750 [Allostella humosa]|nr:hypothetical protein STHU_12750 [Stella humosa]